MSVSKVSATAPVHLPIGAVRPIDPDSGSSQHSSPHDSPPRDQSGQQAPLRFPWLSWETRQLEAASKQPSPYGQVPLLGKTLDQKV
jgi:hypothetical protein